MRAALSWTLTKPAPHACFAVTPSGRRTRPLVVKRGPLRVVSAVTERGAKRLTRTPRTAVAVWPALSVATATSVVRPTSATVSGNAHA